MTTAAKRTATKPKPKEKTRTTLRARPNQRLNSRDLVKVLLTVDEAAHRLSIGRTACYALMKRGELRYILIGSARRIPVDAISEFVAQSSWYGNEIA